MLFNFAYAGSNEEMTDKEVRDFLDNLPTRQIEFLQKECTERTSVDPIFDMVKEGILGIEYAGLTCEKVQELSTLSSLNEITKGFEELATEMKELNNMNCEELKASKTPEQLQALKDIGHKKAIECLS